MIHKNTFECHRCGNCCKVVVLLGEKDIERIKRIVRQFRLECVYEEIEELKMRVCD